jgi:hypothetical protein
MSHKRLGNQSEAMQWHERAKGAAGTVAGTEAELRQFRREAELLFNPPNEDDAAKKAVAEAPATEPSATAPSSETAPAANSQSRSKAGKPPVPPWFSLRSFGMGQLVRMNIADPFPGSDEEWSWLFRTLGGHRMRWTERHGLNARSSNPDFWNFLIEGVGRAPVMMFQVLIAAFTLVIGPVNYFVLRRRKQLYFLIVTVPALALLTTALLLGFAVSSEGFAVRTRVRSVTMLDQAHGEAVSWSRVSYYAGLAPTGGLRFSTETAVYPIEPSESASVGYRVVDWTEGQHLKSGWLLSRTPAQLFLIAHRLAGEQLAVASDGSGKVRVTNNLGCNVKQLYLSDDDGSVFVGQELAPGARTLLTPSDFDEAAKQLQSLLNAQQLVFPSDMKDEVPSAGFSIFGLGMPTTGPAVDSSTSLLEDMLRRLADTTSGTNPLKSARTYVAIAEQPPLVELGVRESVEVGSLYVIVGVY